jgi:tetratricopeptide (TPR) repeat protein
MLRTAIACAALGALGIGAASAAVMVLGEGPAAACYEAARADRGDREALRDCDMALEGPITLRDRVATRINRGIIYVNRRQADQALVDFNEAIRLDPELGEAHVNRGAALMLRGDFRGAIDSINEGIALDTAELHKAYFNRAIAHEELGQLRAAYEDYQRAASLAPEWRSPQVELARFSVRRREQ